MITEQQLEKAGYETYTNPFERVDLYLRTWKREIFDNQGKLKYVLCFNALGESGQEEGICFEVSVELTSRRSTFKISFRDRYSSSLEGIEEWVDDTWKILE